MKRAHAIIRGKVHRSGFRHFIRQQAYFRKVTGIARNLPDGSVEVIAEAAETSLGAFLKDIAKPPWPVEVESIEKERSPATGEFNDFIVEWGPNERLIETLDVGFRPLRKYDRLYSEVVDAAQDVLQPLQHSSTNLTASAAKLKRPSKELREDRKQSRQEMKALITTVRESRE